MTATETAEDSGAGTGPPMLGSVADRTFDSWFDRYGRPYADAVREAGGEAWTDSEQERRALWERRYTRPDPPAGLPPVRSVRDLNAPSRRTPTTTTTTTERY